MASVLAVAGWFARQLWDAVRVLQRDVQLLEIDVSKNYLTKSDFADTMRRIEVMLQRISDKIDEKADK
jgi:hypothetical protein